MAQKMLETMKTISEIISMPWTPETGNQIFTVIAKIDGVYTEAGWFYATCSQCSKMLEVCNGSFWCNICNGSARYPMIRLRVHLCVQDDSADTIFTLYNQQMEHLIDTSAHKLLNRLDVGSDGYPDEIWRLTGKMFAFSVRMPDYFNSDYDFHHHRVVSLTEVDPFPLASLPANRSKKVRRKKTRATFPVGHNDQLHSTNIQSCDTAESSCAVSEKGRA